MKALSATLNEFGDEVYSSITNELLHYKASLDLVVENAKIKTRSYVLEALKSLFFYLIALVALVTSLTYVVYFGLNYLLSTTGLPENYHKLIIATTVLVFLLSLKAYSLIKAEGAISKKQLTKKVTEKKAFATNAKFKKKLIFISTLIIGILIYILSRKKSVNFNTPKNFNRPPTEYQVPFASELKIALQGLFITLVTGYVKDIIDELMTRTSNSKSNLS